MARRRSRRRRRRLVFGSLIVAALAGLAWRVWLRPASPGSDSTSDTGFHTLTSNLNSSVAGAGKATAKGESEAKPDHKAKDGGNERPSPDRPKPALQPVTAPHGRGSPKTSTADAPPARRAGPAVAKPPVPPGTQPAVLPNTGTGPTDFKGGLAAKQRNDFVMSRTLLNRALHAGLPPADDQLARQTLAQLADQTLFSRAVTDGDPLTETYAVREGDTLGKIGTRFKVTEDLLAQINNLRNKNFVRAGARIKVIHGPFHAAVYKSEHLMHLYLQDVYVRTCQVALGTDGGTPRGRWVVDNRKENPDWTDPRTGKRWHQDDPKNPIGEFWIGLEGTSGEAAGAFGYGIHGTIEPQTIGRDVSLGCVRLAPEDIAFVYKLLVPGQSVVTIE